MKFIREKKKLKKIQIRKYNQVTTHYRSTVIKKKKKNVDQLNTVKQYPIVQ